MATKGEDGEFPHREPTPQVHPSVFRSTQLGGQLICGSPTPHHGGAESDSRPADAAMT